METSTLERIKKTAVRLLEPKHLQNGRVLEVREWAPSTFIEIDLHLPAADIQQWEEIPYIKVKVADFTYRDYTPSGWDAETDTCTLYVDASHNGAGSQWAQNLKKGDTISYFKISTTSHTPDATSAIIGLGDESSLGHLMALQQMVLPVARFSGAILMANDQNRGLFGEYFRSPLKTVKSNDVYGHHTLIQWVIDQKYSLDNTIFYLAGNQTMVMQLRQLLKLQGYKSSQVKAQGFWR